ncbi:hypothetical protein BJF90_36140 [Pseudonocardia sp. CNS-004]|nr:hypothetical protein BJF90_36140 [Pseudonocardia sp. CNS-004]
MDAQVHLDKAYVLPRLEALGAFAGGGDGLATALEATRRLRSETGPADLLPSMERLLRSMRRTGTVAARVQVEVDPDIDPATVELHRQLGSAHPDVRLQLVAFPQNGTSERPVMEGRMARALDDGCAVVGGCPYADPDPGRHLDLVVGLARERGLPLDLHLDLTDDPDASLLQLVLPRIARAGLGGRVTVGHMTALSAMSPQRRSECVRALADHGVSVVVLPTTDLWLSGRGDPAVRGVAPVAQLLSAGVRVALASNNHQNAFTPVGSGGLLRVAWLAGLVCHMGDPAGQAALLDAVTSAAADILGLGPWGVTEGSTAPLLLIDAEEPLDAVREAPAVLRRLGS